jgi:hypothetical protein
MLSKIEKPDADDSYIAKRNESERRFAIAYLLFVAITHFLAGLWALMSENVLILFIFFRYSFVLPRAVSVRSFSLLE